MPPVKDQSLPFLTRNMLAFEHGLSLSLRIDMQADAAVTLAIRGMTREGMFTFNATTPSTSLITSAEFRIPDVPIYITVEDVARTLLQGSAFITVSLLANGNVIQQLTSGYIYAQKALSWPNTSQVDLKAGGGKIALITIAAPAVGAQFDSAVPRGEIWKVLSLSFDLTTSATAANRRMIVFFSTTGSAVIRCFGATNQTASLTRTYVAAQYGTMPADTIDQTNLINIPQDIQLIGAAAAGGRIATEIFNDTANDTLGSMFVVVEKFFRTP